MSSTVRLSLYEAAEELGVHYQTAYRWVRRGVLPAVKINGSYEVDVAAVAELRKDREAPLAPPSRRRVRSWEPFAERLHAALVAGDESKVRDLFADLLDSGVALADLCDHVVAPALGRIGDDWADGRLSIAVEHRASAICARALARATPTPPGRPRGLAVVCSPTVESHELPGLMVTAVLRDHHWRVHHLGVGVPADAVEGLVEAEDADVVVISTVWTPAAEEADRLAARLEAPGRKVLVGRPGLTLADLLEDLASS